MTKCKECRYKDTPDCPVKALGDRIGAEIIAEGCTEGVGDRIGAEIIAEGCTEGVGKDE